MLRLLLGWFGLLMAPLPTVGADNNAWGAELNAFLAVAHDPTSGALLDSAVGRSTINFQTGTAYTLQNSDAGKVVSMTNASANVVTVPSDANMTGGAVPVGTLITMREGGAGVTQVVAGSGATVNARGGLSHIAGQYGYATLLKVAANTWELSGDLA